MITTYLIDIVLLLIAAVVAVPFFQAIKSGAVPGFLIAGIIVGPYGFGLISNIREIGNLSEIGVVSETLEASLELAGIALSTLRFDENKQKVILSDFRRKYQLELEDALKDEKRKNWQSLLEIAPVHIKKATARRYKDTRCGAKLGIDLPTE